MYSPIVQTVDVLANILLIFFLMKLLVNPREFYFNSVLRPVDSITEPVLSRLRKYFRPTKYGHDYTPLVAIFALLIFVVLTHWGLEGRGFLFAMVTSFQGVLRFLLRFFAFSVFVLIMVPSYMRNPLSNFLKLVVEPFEKPFKSKSGKSNIGILIGALFLVIVLFTIIFTLTESVLQESPGQWLSNWKVWISFLVYMLILTIGIYKFIVILLIASVILTWINAEIRNPIINLIFVLTEPILLPIRRMLPPAGGLDLSPWIACILIGLVGRLLTGFLSSIHHTII